MVNLPILLAKQGIVKSYDCWLMPSFWWSNPSKPPMFDGQIQFLAGEIPSCWCSNPHVCCLPPILRCSNPKFYHGGWNHNVCCLNHQVWLWKSWHHHLTIVTINSPITMVILTMNWQFLLVELHLSLHCSNSSTCINSSTVSTCPPSAAWCKAVRCRVSSSLGHLGRYSQQFGGDLLDGISWVWWIFPDF